MKQYFFIFFIGTSSVHGMGILRVLCGCLQKRPLAHTVRRAIQSGDIDHARDLLRTIPDINKLPGKPALFAAVDSGKESMVLELLHHGANPRAKHNKKTVIEYAYMLQQRNLASIIIDFLAKNSDSQEQCAVCCESICTIFGTSGIQELYCTQRCCLNFMCYRCAQEWANVKNRCPLCHAENFFIF